MAEIEKIGLGSPKESIQFDQSVNTEFNINDYLNEEDKEVNENDTYKPTVFEESREKLVSPKFNASKFLDNIINLKTSIPPTKEEFKSYKTSKSRSFAPPLRPDKEMKVAIAANKAKADLSIQTLLDKISYGEGATPKLLEKQGKNTSPYDMVYGYKQYLTPSTPVSSMTLKELFTFQNQLIRKTRGTISGKTSKNAGTSAVGKYQILRDTLFGKGRNDTSEKPGIGSWADVLNLKASDTFSPAVQEKIARLALKESGYNNYLKGKKSKANFLKGIARRWASVADLSGTNPSGQSTATSAQSLMPLIDNVKNNGQTINVNDLMIRK
tara:strand:- start:860 stop:1837 length:978 start_codon:yes stop_codon:yes gene_type:complete